MRSFGSYFTTQSRSACSSTATDVYFTPSDVRARSSLVMLIVVKTFPWRPRHVIQTLDRFSSRRLELQLAPSYLAQRWMFWRRWSLSSSASWYAGVSQHLPAYCIFLGLACTPLQLCIVLPEWRINILIVILLLPVFIWILVSSVSMIVRNVDVRWACWTSSKLITRIISSGSSLLGATTPAI